MRGGESELCVVGDGIMCATMLLQIAMAASISREVHDAKREYVTKLNVLEHGFLVWEGKMKSEVFEEVVVDGA